MRSLTRLQPDFAERLSEPGMLIMSLIDRRGPPATRSDTSDLALDLPTASALEPE
jgi:hypothetical protein